MSVRACVRASVCNYCLKSEGKPRNQLKSSYCSSRLDKEGTGEVSWLKEGCYGVRDKIGKSNKSVLRVKAGIEGRLCISTTVKVETFLEISLKAVTVPLGWIRKVQVR